jgi:hypothetical protein
MRIKATCPVCDNIIITNKSMRDVDLSNHIESAHPEVYKRASEINIEIITLLDELRTLTNCYDRRMFIMPLNEAKMYKYGMNIFYGKSGAVIGHMDANYLSECERLIKIELDLENAVELFYAKTNQPVVHTGKFIQSDSDGFCSLIK